MTCFIFMSGDHSQVDLLNSISGSFEKVRLQMFDNKFAPRRFLEANPADEIGV